MTRDGKLTLASGCAVLALALHAQPSVADAEPDTGSAASEAGVLDEIVVTARRKAENEQKVPVSVTAIGSAQIAKQNLTNTQSLNNVGTGLTVADNGDRSVVTFSMRGQTQLPNGPDPGVQIYFDELPLLSGALGFYDLAQIEVLHGPQGTLFGRNTTGGAVVIRPQTPTNEFDGYLQGTVGNLDARNVEGAVNLPIIDNKLAVRISGTVIRREGYVTNLENGEKLNNDHTNSIRAQIRYTPFDGFEDRLLLDYMVVANRGTAQMPGRPVTLLDAFGPIVGPIYGPFLEATAPTGDAALAAAYALAQASHYRQFRSNVPAVYEQHDFLAENIASWQFGAGLTLRNITGFSTDRVNRVGDLDATPQTLLEAGSTYSNHLFTNELQLLGKSLDDRLDWVAGFYYEKKKPVAPTIVSEFLPLGPSYISYEITGESKAVYAQATYHLTPELSVTAGSRYTWDKRDAIDGDGTALPVVENISQKFSSSAPNWTASVNYQLNPDVLLYVATRRGYKAGGVNPLVEAPLPTNYNAETLTDVEVGEKAEWSMGIVRNRLNVAAYYGRYNDMQRQTIVPNGASLVTTVFSAGKANIKGVEAQYTAKFGSVADLSVQYSHSDVNYTKYLVPTALGTIEDLAGSQADFAPRNKGAVSGTVYAPQMGQYGTLSATTTYSYQSSVIFFEPAVPNYGNPGYGLWDFSIDWEQPFNHPFDVSLFVQNAADKHYFLGGGQPYWSMVEPGAPRTYGLKVRYRFGASAR